MSSSTQPMPGDSAKASDDLDSPKAKKTSRKDKHKKSSSKHKSKDNDDDDDKKEKKRKKKKHRVKELEGESSAPSSAAPTPQKPTLAGSSPAVEKVHHGKPTAAATTAGIQNVQHGLLQAPSPSTPQKRASASSQELLMPQHPPASATKKQSVSTPQQQQQEASTTKRPASTPKKPAAPAPSNQPASAPAKRLSKPPSPTRFEVRIPSSAKAKKDYVEMTLDSNDESVEVSPTPSPDQKLLSGLQFLKKEKDHTLSSEAMSHVETEPPSEKKKKTTKSRKIKTETGSQPSPAKSTKKKKSRPVVREDFGDVVQLSSGADTDSELELQAIYDTPQRRNAVKASGQDKAPAPKGRASPDSDVEVQAVRRTPKGRSRSRSQPPGSKSPAMAPPNMETPSKMAQADKWSTSVNEGSSSKEKGSGGFQGRAERARTMSPSLGRRKQSHGLSEKQQAFIPKDTPAPSRKSKAAARAVPEQTDCIDLTSALTSDSDSDTASIPAHVTTKQSSLGTAAGWNGSTKRSWDEMHSGSPPPGNETETPRKRRKLEAVISRIVRSSLRQEEQESPFSQEHALQQRRRRHSAEALAYFHLTGWKKLAKRRRQSPMVSKKRGVAALFSWAEVKRLKKMARERAG